MSKHQNKELDSARDDLLSHIHRCGVLKALPDHQMEWMAETVEYLGECYPGLGEGELAELKEIGMRFCQPVIPHGKGHSALTVGQDGGSQAVVGEEAEQGEELTAV